MHRLRHIFILILVAGVAALVVLGLRPSPLLVDTEAVSRGYLAGTIEEEGRTRVRDSYEISAPVTGHAARILLDVGDTVQEGDVVAILDAVAAPTLDVRSVAQARALVEAAKSAVSQAREEAVAAEAAARFAQEEYRRLQPLGAEGLVAFNVVDAARADADAALARHRSTLFRVKTAEHDLAAARTALAFAGGQDPGASGRIELTSPVSGRVLTRHFQSAKVVQPGEPILEIGDPAGLEVEVDVLSADAVRLEPGMRVFLERWGKPEPLEAVVQRIEPVGFTKISALGVEEQRVLVIADLVGKQEQWARLGHGYRVNARFVLWEESEALRVPTSALFRHAQGQDSEWAVFLAEEGRATLRPVEVGRRGGIASEVLSGLQERDVVVVHPDRNLEHGMRIRVQ
ncbi:MAG TPA: HlyD family efflux transporter periplasmic adaptor subunit [Desulfonatronum sp.]|nr:HlyD family efflux transporter periplasmic adaptor subunit [Desulfonatronum sp.]